MSLGQAIQAVRPLTASPTIEAQRAEYDARGMISESEQARARRATTGQHTTVAKTTPRRRSRRPGPMIRRAAGTLAICLAASVVPVAAQGNGHGHAYGLLKSSAPTPSSGGAAQVQPAVAGGVRNFGSWLDDASIMTPGSGSLTMSVAWFRSPAYHEFDAPIGDGAIGLTLEDSVRLQRPVLPRQRTRRPCRSRDWGLVSDLEGAASRTRRHARTGSAWQLCPS